MYVSILMLYLNSKKHFSLYAAFHVCIILSMNFKCYKLRCINGHYIDTYLGET